VLLCFKYMIKQADCQEVEMAYLDHKDMLYYYYEYSYPLLCLVPGNNWTE